MIQLKVLQEKSYSAVWQEVDNRFKAEVRELLVLKWHGSKKNKICEINFNIFLFWPSIFIWIKNKCLLNTGFIFGKPCIIKKKKNVFSWYLKNINNKTDISLFMIHIQSWKPAAAYSLFPRSCLTFNIWIILYLESYFPLV